MLDRIRIFIKVAECGSFSRAGKALELTPSSISRHVDRLEAELGTKLFHRSTRQLSLTEPGTNLLNSSRQLVLNFDAVIASIQVDKTEPQGRLKISVFESFGRLYISPLIPRFLAMYPKVKIDITLDNQIADLYRDELDLAIRVGNPVDSRLKIRKLAANKMVVCASANYLKKKGRPTHPQDLAERNCLVISHNRQATWWHFRRKKDYQKVQVSGSIMSSGGTPLLEAAKQDLGILMLSEWMVREQLKRGELTRLLEEWHPSLYEEGSGDVYLVFKDDKYMQPALRKFIDFIVEQIGI